MLRLSVVIPTLNAERELPACLESIRSQAADTGTYEIIVADGGSTDRTAAIAEKAGARVVSNPDRRAEPGVAVGMGAARADLVTVMAADNRMRGRDFMDRMAAAFAEPSVMAAFPRVVGTAADGLAGRYMNRYSDPFTNFVYGVENTSIDVMVRHRSGAALLLSPTVAKHPMLAVAQGCTVRRGLVYGGPAPEADDVLAIIGLIQSGGRIALVPDAELEHHHVSGLRSFYGKYRSRARASLVGNQGYLRRRAYLSRGRRARTWVWPLYSATIVAPVLHGALRAVRYRDPLALYHPVVNTVLLLALLREIVPYTFRRLASRGSETRASA